MSNNRQTKLFDDDGDIRRRYVGMPTLIPLQHRNQSIF